MTCNFNIWLSVLGAPSLSFPNIIICTVIMLGQFSQIIVMKKEVYKNSYFSQPFNLKMLPLLQGPSILSKHAWISRHSICLVGVQLSFQKHSLFRECTNYHMRFVEVSSSFTRITATITPTIATPPGIPVHKHMFTQTHSLDRRFLLNGPEPLTTGTFWWQCGWIRRKCWNSLESEMC